MLSVSILRYIAAVLNWFRRISGMPAQFASASMMMTLAGLIEHANGRKLWGNDGPGLWSGKVLSPHNSQYVADPYTFSHLSHGIVLYGLASLILRKASPGARFVAAVAAECLWEVVENTDFVINRYRAATISLNYYGDSIVNSMFDIVACIAGLLIARALAVRYAVLLLIVLEVSLALAIRDGLFLNLLMLIDPIPAVKHWQGAP